MNTTSMDTAPEDFVCPLTLQVMVNPVTDPATKYTFERSAINEWLYFGQQKCPLTRRPLHPKDLYPNVALQARIQRWKRINNVMQEIEQEIENVEDEEGNETIIIPKIKIDVSVFITQNAAATAAVAVDDKNDTSKILSIRDKVMQKHQRMIQNRMSRPKGNTYITNMNRLRSKSN